MLGVASQCKNLATLMEMKPERKSLGRNPLSDAPYRNPGMVLNGQGPGRHPRDAPCRDLDTVTSEQGSGRRILRARHIGAWVWCKMSKGLHTYLGGCKG